ncbi:MAG: class I SAM-dependent methyltransferase [Ruegeria sp.]
MAVRELYRQNDYPVFQNRMHDTAESARACDAGILRLVQDEETGLVFNEAFDPALLHYDSSYQNEQGHSPVFDAHMEQVADLILTKMGKQSLIEVGCGKGLFLAKLRDKGAEITGFDPAYEGDDPSIVKELFDDSKPMQGRGLILRHVLEHISDPVGFLHQLSAANGNQGLIYIEVPCFDWILANKAWFDLFYEHVNYFRLSDFDRIFERTVHLGRGFNNQYLTVIADLSSIRTPVAQDADKVQLPYSFMPDLSSVGTSGQIIWGGASKGVIYGLLSQRAGRPVARVIDINPAKQGKFLAATGLKVEAPEAVLPELAAGTTIVVMNPNYMSEIQSMGGPGFNYVSVHDI